MNGSWFRLASTVAVVVALAWPMTAWAASDPPRLLADVFSDHAILQHGRTIPLWGKAAPGETITATLAGHSAVGRSRSDGRWTLTLPALPAGGPHDLTVESGSGVRQTLSDLLMGDVWLCSGQSNMAWPVRDSLDAEREIAAADWPRLRLLTVAQADASVPADGLAGTPGWQVASPATVAGFSAACYFFGRDLMAARSVPVGLINASWNGSIARAWISDQGLRAVGGYDAELDLVALRATVPDAAAVRWEQRMEDWWQANDPGQAASPSWSDPGLPDADWVPIGVPGPWEQSGEAALRQFDGVVWFRSNLDLSAAAAERPATLVLGRIDDWDTVWINGVRVGQAQGHRLSRRYGVPAGVLRQGRNRIAVRVLDGGSGGGFIDGEAFSLTFEGAASVPLSGIWHYRIAASLPDLLPLPETPWLGAHGTTVLFNGMIAPLVPYGLKGVAWYQGESDRNWPVEYARLLPALLADWRSAFGQDLPFLVVQLAGFGATHDTPQPSPFADIREVQRRTVLADGNAALIVATDIGAADTIHPLNKQEVGRRLALAARALAYDEPVTGSGPTIRSARLAEGGIVLTFDAAGPGLRTTDGRDPVGFQVCDDSSVCRFFAGRLSGAEVRLDLDQPYSRIRYCWNDLPRCNLTDKTGLPAAAFEITVQRDPD